MEINETDTLEIIKVRYNHIDVRRNDKKIYIPDYQYHYFVKMSVRDSIMQVLDDMRQEAEDNTQRARDMTRDKEWKGNLEKYNRALAEFSHSQSGPVAIRAQERAYGGKVPFSEFLDKTRDSDQGRKEKVRTFLDETFSFHPKRVSDYKGNQSIIGDTFGIGVDLRNGYTDDILFVNLRTGEGYSLKDMKPFLESNTYLRYLSQFPEFVYDGTYSINEVLDPVRFGDFNSERITDALVGEQVFVPETLQYDTIASVVKEVSTYNDDVSYLIYLKSGAKKYPRGIVSVKWYGELQKLIGRQVLYVRTYDDFNVNGIYQEDLPKLGPWTLEKIEAGKDDRGINGLFVTIRKGGDVKVLDWESCTFLTHDIDFDREYAGVWYPDPLLLSYDFMKANVIKMPEYVRRERQATQKYLEAVISDAMTDGVANGMMVGMSLTTFLRKFPKAKLVKSAVNANGKVVKIYHARSWEVVFVNGKCTSCVKE